LQAGGKHSRLCPQVDLSALNSIVFGRSTPPPRLPRCLLATRNKLEDFFGRVSAIIWDLTTPIWIVATRQGGPDVG
jgi:hypothetical protein